MKYHGICNRVFQKNTLNTIADDTNSAGDKIHPIVYVMSDCWCICNDIFILDCPNYRCSTEVKTVPNKNK